MFSILWPLTQKKEEKQDLDEQRESVIFNDVVVSQYDEEAEVQEMIWQMIIRRIEPENPRHIDETQPLGLHSRTVDPNTGYDELPHAAPLMSVN